METVFVLVLFLSVCLPRNSIVMTYVTAYLTTYVTMYVTVYVNMCVTVYVTVYVTAYVSVYVTVYVTVYMTVYVMGYVTDPPCHQVFFDSRDKRKRGAETSLQHPALRR